MKNKYLPLFWDKHQIPALIYRIYINIFGIFLRIPILPMGFSWKWKTFDIWYHGDQVICYWKKGKLRYQDLGCQGDFASLKEIDDFYKEIDKYFEQNDKNKEYNLCTNLFCQHEGEQK